MSRETNLATQEKATEYLNAGDVDAAVNTLFAANAVDHDPAPGHGQGREGYRTFYHTLAKAFPDAKFEPAAMVADEEYVCLAYTLPGTHQGDFMASRPPVSGSRSAGCRSAGSRTGRSWSGGGVRTSSGSCSSSAPPRCPAGSSA